MSYEEEDTCMSYEEEETCGRPAHHITPPWCRNSEKSVPYCIYHIKSLCLLHKVSVESTRCVYYTKSLYSLHKVSVFTI
jgi:hypothetical protein